MAGNRVLEPPRNLDPELRLRSQVADLSARLALLERNSSVQVQRLTSAASFTVDVAPGVSMVTIEFELLSDPAGELLIRPNGNSSTLVTDNLYTSSTVSPNAITGPTVSQSSLAGGRAAAATGGTGLAGHLGVVQAQVRPASGGRRVWGARVRTTNTAGSSNFYTYTWIAGGVLDANIGATTLISTLQFIPSTGTISSGTVKATFT